MDNSQELLSQVLTSTTRVEAVVGGLASVLDELKDQVRQVVRTQGDHSERLTHTEARVYEVQPIRADVARLQAELSQLKSEVAALTATQTAHTPQKTPWTAVISASVAVLALLWTFFGR